MTDIYNFDVVVAGSGGTGLSAAHTAAQNGLKVLVIEKLNQIGGNTRISSGFFAIDTIEQRKQGIQLSYDEAVKQLMEYSHYLNNGSLVKQVVKNAKPTLEEIKKMGMKIKLNPVTETTQFAHRNNLYAGGSYHMYEDKQESYKNIQDYMEKEGVEFWFDTSFEKLLHDENGTIIGAQVTNNIGEIIKIKAKATIIATGGFGGNKDKVAQVMKTTNLRTLGVPNMGEGLDAMEEAGAVDIDGTALIHAAQLAKSAVSKESNKQHLAGFSNSPITRLLLTPLLWVNDFGTRFTNEDVVYDTVKWANAGWSVGGKYFLIVDSSTLKDYDIKPQLEVSKAGPGASTDKGDFIKLADLAVEQKTAFKGNSIEELAEKTGMKKSTLCKTVENYNKIIEQNEDTEFSKSKDSLVYDIKNGPFYAFIAQVAYLGTIGGVRTDSHMRVLDKNLNIIRGLYTGGANAGGYYEGHSYPAYEGLASGFAWTSGRLAGLAAVKDIQNKE